MTRGGTSTRNLLSRLDLRKQDVLRFLSDTDVPFTNTLAERDVHMMKAGLEHAPDDHGHPATLIAAPRIS